MFDRVKTKVEECDLDYIAFLKNPKPKQEMSDTEFEKYRKKRSSYKLYHNGVVLKIKSVRAWRNRSWPTEYPSEDKVCESEMNSTNSLENDEFSSDNSDYCDSDFSEDSILDIDKENISKEVQEDAHGLGPPDEMEVDLQILWDTKNKADTSATKASFQSPLLVKLVVDPKTNSKEKRGENNNVKIGYLRDEAVLFFQSSKKNRKSGFCEIRLCFRNNEMLQEFLDKVNNAVSVHKLHAMEGLKEPVEPKSTIFREK